LTEKLGMPYSEEAEVAVISSMLMDMGATAEVSTTLNPDDFYFPAHQIIYSAILDVYNKGQKVDIVTVVERLKKNDLLEKVGGSSYVASFVRGSVSAENIIYYADIVSEKSILRDLIKKSKSIIDKASSAKEEVEEVLDEAENLIFDVRKKKSYERVKPIAPLLKEVMKVIQDRADKKSMITGIPTGFIELNKMSCGFQNAELIILAARPSVGKTALALNLASHISIREEIPVLFFSLEMHWESLIFRLLSSEARIEGNKIRRGNLDSKEDEWTKLTSAISKFTEAPFYIDASPSMTIFELRAKARRMKKKYNIGVIFADYLQLIRGPQFQTREQEVAAISRALKSIAMELNIPVVALSQLSRQPERRGKDSKPILSDLRESGAIEQDADFVIFIHRPDQFKKSSEVPVDDAKLIIAKQRNGPVGEVALKFHRKYARFVDDLKMVETEE
jgi:replicative DNA helicase